MIPFYVSSESGTASKAVGVVYREMFYHQLKQFDWESSGFNQTTSTFVRSCHMLFPFRWLRFGGTSNCSRRGDRQIGWQAAR